MPYQVRRDFIGYGARAHSARAVGLARLLDHMMRLQGLWICRRSEIARHWAATHPDPGQRVNEG